jgi:spore germination cell wall hydrolase CwlJ-like protein
MLIAQTPPPTPAIPPGPADYFLCALALWREARGEGQNGMTAVACVIRNRTAKRSSSYYDEVVRPWAFSSISAKGDPQLNSFPVHYDPIWQAAQMIAKNVIDGILTDNTGGATLYWNPAGITSSKTFTLADGGTVKFPQTWNLAVVRETVKIGQHIFLKEM